MKEEIYILFDKYLNKELSTIEINSFHEQLETNLEFKAEFEIYTALEKSLSSKYENEQATKDLKSTLSNLGNQYIKKESKVISLLRFKPLMVAASIALLIGFFLFNNGEPVYSDYSNHNSLELVVRGDNEEEFVKAEDSFNLENYEAALELLTIASKNNPKNIEILLYKGICDLELNNYNSAAKIFNKISTGNSAFSNTAKWYKALNFLKQEKIKECKQVLKTIPSSADEFLKAEKLLKKL